MLFRSLGALLAAVRGGEASVIGGLLACYLVITALTTVSPPEANPRWLAVGALLLALGIGLASATLGFEAVSLGGRRQKRRQHDPRLGAVGGHADDHAAPSEHAKSERDRDHGFASYHVCGRQDREASGNIMTRSANKSLIETV